MQMKIQAKIERLVKGGSVKAVASITLDSWFVVKNLRVVDGRKGLFVSMPQEFYTDKNGEKKYSNVFFPITNAAKCAIQDAVLKAYSQHMDQQYADQQNSQCEKLDDGFLPFEM